jgi:hypothetical protein
VVAVLVLVLPQTAVVGGQAVEAVEVEAAVRALLVREITEEALLDFNPVAVAGLVKLECQEPRNLMGVMV